MTPSDPRPDRRAFLGGGLVSCLAAESLLGAEGAEGADEARTGVVTLILVRHAEKGTDPDAPRDPGLTERGTERARTLASLLAPAGADCLVATEYRRTRETLAPLSRATGVEVTVRPARDLEALAAELAALPAGTVVALAGHSNTIPALVRAFGGTIDRLDEKGNLGEDEYGRLFLLPVERRPDGPARALATIELRYGE
ncbi:MAG: SixA phosphatase family protein [Planctomycetota bacterium JB042]